MSPRKKMLLLMKDTEMLLILYRHVSFLNLSTRRRDEGSSSLPCTTFLNKSRKKKSRRNFFAATCNIRKQPQQKQNTVNVPTCRNTHDLIHVFPSDCVMIISLKESLVLLGHKYVSVLFLRTDINIKCWWATGEGRGESWVF
jgi:hypothetical protein